MKEEDFTETALGLNMEMVYVAGGEFEMGGTAEQGDDAEDNEKPVRTVRLDGYHIGRYEVTQAQWKAVMGTTIEQRFAKAKNYCREYYSRKGVGDTYPMYYVSWRAAQAFCQKLSEQTGKKYMLPTEAMWEYAARGGNKSRHYKYAGSNDIEKVAWYEGNMYPPVGTHPVGMKKANELGIYDMIGNVWEWCSDWCRNYGANDTENSQEPAEDAYFVMRGGSWATDAVECRVSDRGFRQANEYFNDNGLRVVCCSKENGEDFTEKALGLNMEMVYVEGGESWLGATVEQGDAAYSLGRVQKVKLEDYHIGKYPVTQAQWKAVMGRNPSWFEGDNRPVEHVSWKKAQEFCRKLSEATGMKYMLPTEAQWEYAARGGKKSRHYKYAGSNDLDEVAWYRSSFHCDINILPVGMKMGNELGIHEMSGSVREWCSDWYGRYDGKDTDNPQGPTSGEYHVARGGGRNDEAAFCRVSCRYNDIPDRDHNRGYEFFGFRVAVLL